MYDEHHSRLLVAISFLIHLETLKMYNHKDAQGVFCLETAENCLEALNEMFAAIPAKKRIEFIGHLNEISLVLERGKREWPKMSGNLNNA